MPPFGSSGIRGPALTEVSPDLMLRLGMAVGEAHHRVVVGRDGRLTGPVLQQAFNAGAFAAGAEVHDASSTLWHSPRGQDHRRRR